MTTYHDRFEEICAEMVALHNKKGADYGGVNDPYANVRASQEFGVAPWIGALIRLNDKITRLKSFIRNGNLMNESVEDSIEDIAVYAVIMRILKDEEKAKQFAEVTGRDLIPSEVILSGTLYHGTPRPRGNAPPPFAIPSNTA